jgi:hypothetical protein
MRRTKNNTLLMPGSQRASGVARRANATLVQGGSMGFVRKSTDVSANANEQDEDGEPVFPLHLSRRTAPPPPPPPTRSPAPEARIMHLSNLISHDDATPPLSVRPPMSSRFESQWFSTPPLPPLVSMSSPILRSPGPLLTDLEERRGWTPPSGTRGAAFAMVSILLIGVAVAGTFFLLGPDSKQSKGPEPISTTLVTGADVVPSSTSTTSTTSTTSAETDPTTATAPTVQRTITPNDLPTAKLDGPTTTSTNTAHKTPIAAMATAPAFAAIPAQRHATPLKTDTRAGSSNALPDLDRAAKATGMTPSSSPSADDANFATPSPAPSPTSPSDDNKQSSSPEPVPAPAPSDVVPDLQIKR